MIEFTIQYGKRAGTHYIFENTTEACKWLNEDLKHLNTNNQDLSNELTAFKLWNNTDNIKGDWVKSDDGKVIQIFNVNHFNSNQNTNKVFNVKVCCGNFYHYQNKDGTNKSRRMLITPEQLSKSAKERVSIGTVTTLGKHLTVRKKKFCYYCVVFGNPHRALMQLRLDENKPPSGGFERLFKSPRFIHSAFELLEDKTVQEGISKYMPTDKFQAKLKKALEEKGLNEEYTADQILKGFQAIERNNKQGTLTHNAFIEKLAQIQKFVNDDSKSQNLLDNIDKGPVERSKIAEAEFELLPPPDKSIMDTIPDDMKKTVEDINDKILDDYIEQQKEEYKNLQSNNNNS